MSREIKFRAWDEDNKRMIVNTQDFIPLKVTNIGVFKLDPYIEENRWILLDSNRFIVEQYTGLKDKNGKEIYENDIVKNSNSGIREVGFNDRRSQFGLYSRQLECWITNELINDTWEIIGNIHEDQK